MNLLLKPPPMFEFLKKYIGEDPNIFWEKTGFVEGIYNKEIKDKLIKGLSDIAEWLLNNPDKLKYSVPSLNIDFNNVIFPIVVRIMRKRPETEIANIENIYNYIVWYYYHYLDYYLGVKKHQQLDAEAQLCCDCADEMIKELKEKDKIAEKDNGTE